MSVRLLGDWARYPGIGQCFFQGHARWVVTIIGQAEAVKARLLISRRALTRRGWNLIDGTKPENRAGCGLYATAWLTSSMAKCVGQRPHPIGNSRHPKRESRQKAMECSPLWIGNLWERNPQRFPGAMRHVPRSLKHGLLGVLPCSLMNHSVHWMP